MSEKPAGLFITGTNTGVGKTYVTSLIARELQEAGVRVGMYKPVCSGSETNDAGETVWPDVETLSTAVGHQFDREMICPQRFAAPLAPPSAARLEGRTVDRELLRSGANCWTGRVDVLLVEAVGGWLCPIAEGETVADLAADIGYPILIVSALELGGINHTLLTVQAVQNCGLPIAGIVLNHAQPTVDSVLEREMVASIREFSSAPILGTVAHNGGCRLPESDSPLRIDWRALMKKRAEIADNMRQADGV